jgi:hypothetical protein
MGQFIAPPRRQLRLSLHYMPDSLDRVSVSLLDLGFAASGVPTGHILATEYIRLAQAPVTLEAAAEAVEVALTRWRLW